MNSTSSLLASPLIVALDCATSAQALELAKQLNPQQCRVKVGKELFIAAGPSVVEQLQALGFEVFLDLKLFDIPNTVAGAVASAADLGVWMLTLHAMGGRSMLHAAVMSVQEKSHAPLLIGVTVLTSMNATQLAETGVESGLQDHVMRLANLCQGVGLNGCVASAQEAPLFRSSFGRAFTLVTPGIRFAKAAEPNSKDDQQRVCTPKEAIVNGSTYLVMGRPITQASDPQKAVEKVLADLALSSF